MQDIKPDAWQTVMIAIIVLFIGRLLTRKIKFLPRYNIPEPVSGGIVISLFVAVFYGLTGSTISFDLFYRDVLLIVFFTCIGLSSRVSDLIKGGKPLFILLVLSAILLVLQDLVGVSLATVMGIDRNAGLLGGSISMSGGHGTAIAWGKIMQEDYGTSNAMEIGVACATIGLIMGGFAGGPIAGFLIHKHHLQPQKDIHLSVEVKGEEDKPLSADSFLLTVFILGIAIAIGTLLNEILARVNFRLPTYVTCLFSGILLTNSVPLFWKSIPWPTKNASLPLISDISLGLFLSMSLMSLQLWTLVSLAAPIMVIMAAQLLLVVFFTTIVIFRALKGNYDAAVMCSGMAGLTLGATPTAIANMTAVSGKFGPSPQSFIIVPLIGAFFIDLVNAVIIELFLLYS